MMSKRRSCLSRRRWYGQWNPGYIGVCLGDVGVCLRDIDVCLRHVVINSDV